MKLVQKENVLRYVHVFSFEINYLDLDTLLNDMGKRYSKIKDHSNYLSSNCIKIK